MLAIRFRILLIILAFSGFDRLLQAEHQKADLLLIEKTSLDLLNANAAKPDDSIKVKELPDGTKIMWGRLFDEQAVALVNFFPRPVNDGAFDYPPCHLSLARFFDGSWHYAQYLGSASRYDFKERKDLRLKIVQGWCQTGRNEGEQASWRWDRNQKKLIPTGWDDWGAYRLIGDYIVYQRGTERLAHWNTRWVYRFDESKVGELVACFHEDDEGRWTISYRKTPGSKGFTRWAFVPDQDHPENVAVRDVADETAFDGDEVAQLKLAKGHDLGQGFCFELLTRLSVHLLNDDWLEKLPAPNVKMHSKIEATGNSEVIARFQRPQDK